MELTELTQVIRNEAMKMLKAERCTLFLVDDEREHLFFHTDETEGGKRVQIPINHGIAGEVAATGKTVNIADVYEDARFNQEIDRQTGFRTKAMLCMPIFDPANQVIRVTLYSTARENTWYLQW